MMTIVVTGVGGPLGQAEIKAARCSSLPLRIVGTDRFELSVGLSWVDKAVLLPDCRDAEAYLDRMCEVCAQECAAALLPGSDSELELLSEHAARILDQSGTRVIASRPEALRIALDKLETCEFLKQHGLACPASRPLYKLEDVEALAEERGFPLFVKPRRGSGSRGTTLLRGIDDARRLDFHEQDLIVQEYVGSEEEEYTTASFTDRHGQPIGSIGFRRELIAGNTYRAWVTRNEAIHHETLAVVRALRPTGPCNVQMRLTATGPVTFEINPRFSGTTAMRAHFGYNEVEMALRSYVLHEDIPVPMVRDGIALRFWEESYIDQ
jgi:carbamoyl-phosphate synthase large subunit